MTEPESLTWTRQDDGSYRNPAGWRIKMIAQGCWRITRPNGFHADQYVYATAGEAQARVDRRYSRLNIA